MDKHLGIIDFLGNEQDGQEPFRSDGRCLPLDERPWQTRRAARHSRSRHPLRKIPAMMMTQMVRKPSVRPKETMIGTSAVP